MINPIGTKSTPVDLQIKNSIEQSQNGDFQKALDNAINQKDDKKLREACRQLESVFVNMMFKQMRSTVQKTDLMGDDSSVETYEDMLFDNYATEMSKGKGVGIAEMLYKQMSKTLQKSEGENAK